MRNILVVDDSALMRRVICDIINTDKQFQANDVCRDGLEAYERLKTTSYDAVILELVKADCRWIIHAAVGLDMFYGGENRGKSRAM